MDDMLIDIDISECQTQRYRVKRSFTQERGHNSSNFEHTIKALSEARSYLDRYERANLNEHMAGENAACINDFTNNLSTFRQALCEAALGQLSRIFNVISDECSKQSEDSNLLRAPQVAKVKSTKLYPEYLERLTEYFQVVYAQRTCENDARSKAQHTAAAVFRFFLLSKRPSRPVDLDEVLRFTPASQSLTDTRTSDECERHSSGQVDANQFAWEEDATEERLTSTLRDACFVLYNYARMCKLVIRFEAEVRCGRYAPLSPYDSCDFTRLLESDKELARLVTQFLNPKIILERASKSSQIHGLCQNMIKFAHRFSRYYNQHRVLTEPYPGANETIHAKIHLVMLFRRQLELLFSVIGIRPLDEM